MQIALPIQPRFERFSEAAAFIKNLKLGSREAVVTISRHGQTTFNVAGALQAHEPDDDRLTPKGCSDAFRLKASLDLLKPTPDQPAFQWAASSTSIRAIRSIQLALPGMERVMLPDLREYNFGQLSGKTWDGPDCDFARQQPALYDVYMRNRTKLDLTSLGGESYAIFRDRIHRVLTQVILPHSFGGVSFILAHTHPVRELLLQTVFGTDIDHLKLEIKGTSASIVYFKENGSAELLLFNNADHLVGQAA